MNEVPAEDKQSWIAIFFLSILIIKLILKFFFPLSYKKINSLETYLSFRTQNNFLFTFFVFFLVNLLKIFLLYVFLSTSFSFRIKNELSSYRLFLFLSMLFFLLFLLKFIFNKLIFYTFSEKKNFDKIYKTEAFYLWKDLKIIFPASLLLTYSVLAPNLIFIFLILCFIYRKVQKWISLIKEIIFPNRISFCYIIFYICVVELLPVLAIFNSTIDLK